MKKILLTALCAMMTLVAGAKDYTEQLVVTVDGVSSVPQEAKVLVDMNSESISLTLKNFIMNLEDDDMYVGNIQVENLQLTKESNFSSFSFEGDILIQEGDPMKDKYGDDVEWIGPKLGPVPSKLSGKISDNKLYLTIDIDMVTLGQMIYVKVGSDDFNVKTYTEQLVVTVDGVSSLPQDAKVLVDMNSETISFTLKNFIMNLEDDDMYVGNIQVENLQLTKESNFSSFSFEGDILIQEGDPMKDKYGDDVEWIGPKLGPVPSKLSGKISDNKLYLTIDIDMVTLGQMIYVQVGSDIQPEVTIGTLTKKIDDYKSGSASKNDINEVVDQILKK